MKNKEVSEKDIKKNITTLVKSLKLNKVDEKIATTHIYEAVVKIMMLDLFRTVTKSK